MIVTVSVEDPAWEAVPLQLEALALRAIDTVARHEFFDEIEREVAILFCSDAEMTRINAKWRGKDASTNVLSFPAPAGHPEVPGDPCFLGDIAVAFGVCRAEAEAQGKSLEDHVTHLLIHAMYHLLGYDHENGEEAVAMEAREIAALAELGIGNPY